MKIDNLIKQQIDDFKDMFTYSPSHTRWWWRTKEWEKDQEVQIKLVTDFMTSTMLKAHELGARERAGDIKVSLEKVISMAKTDRVKEVLQAVVDSLGEFLKDENNKNRKN